MIKILTLKAGRTLRFLKNCHLTYPRAKNISAREYRTAVLSSVFGDGFILSTGAVLQFSQELVEFVVFFTDYGQVAHLEDLMKTGITLKLPASPQFCNPR